MTNPVIQTDIADVLGQIDQKLDKLTEDVTDLKVGQAEIKGEIKALDIKTQSPKVILLAKSFIGQAIAKNNVKNISLGRTQLKKKINFN